MQIYLTNSNIFSITVKKATAPTNFIIQKLVNILQAGCSRSKNNTYLTVLHQNVGESKSMRQMICLNVKKIRLYTYTLINKANFW